MLTASLRVDCSIYKTCLRKGFAAAAASFFPIDGKETKGSLGDGSR